MASTAAWQTDQLKQLPQHVKNSASPHQHLMLMAGLVFGAAKMLPARAPSHTLFCVHHAASEQQHRRSQKSSDGGLKVQPPVKPTQDDARGCKHRGTE
jgi:hypothetical protein